MPSWSTLVDEFKNLRTNEEKSFWIDQRLKAELEKIANRRNTNLIVYASGFLQKPHAPNFLTSISREDINGFMTAVNGLDFSKGLSLILHTPGGEMASTETIVDYLRNKFSHVETIVPVYALSGGTMIALNSEKIIMGRQSQLGPIDAQLSFANGVLPASSILRQFQKAREEIERDRNAAVVWAPILQSMGPALLEQAQDAVELGQEMAQVGLASFMFEEMGDDDAERKAEEVAEYFNATSVHLDHGRRIGVEECIEQGLKVERLEENQDFQDEVLTTYHLLTIIFEQTSAVKVMKNHNGNGWVKNFTAVANSSNQ